MDDAATPRTSDTTTFGCTLEVERSSAVRCGAALIGTPRFRHQHLRRNLTGVAARLMAMGNDDVDAVVNMSLGMFGTTRQRHRWDVGFVGLIDDIARRRAACDGDRIDRELCGLFRKWSAGNGAVSRVIGSCR